MTANADCSLFLFKKVLPDGRVIEVQAMLFTWRLTIGDGVNFVDDAYCYKDKEVAVAAAEVWDGETEPIGWHRHPMSGRRRENGDPAKEVVRH